MRLRRQLATYLLAALLATALVASTAAAAPRQRFGRAPGRPPGSKLLGSVSSPTELTLTFALKPRDPAALASYAASVGDPGSAEYRRFLSVSQFAARFGASPATVAAVRASLRAHGLGEAQLSGNHLSLSLRADAGAVARAFSTSFERLSLKDGRTAVRNTTAPQVDAAVAGALQSIAGLDTIAKPHPTALRRPGAGRPSHETAHLSGGSGASPCATASTALGSSSNAGAYSADQIAAGYSFSGLYGAGDLGAGQTVALYELEGDFPSDITAYASCFGASASVSYTKVDGGPAAPSARRGDGIETALDADNVLGLAPQANLLIYQGPDTEQGALDTFESIVSQDRARVVSTSWGDCEADLGSSDARAENTTFEEAAVQGQTVVAASGDSGAQDCYDINHSVAAAVDDPASQPLVTGVGGTTLSTTSPVSEKTWNSGFTGSGAGGGGNSSLWTMPSYQSSAPASLNVVNAQSSGTPCGASSGTLCREVPDVSADADPATGYLVYWNGNGSTTDSGAWITIGGTSGAAPLWGALFSLVNANSGCAGHALGPVNSALYTAAAGSGSFHDVTTGNNDWVGTNLGEFAAGSGYDQATGLGSPDASGLVAALCQFSLTITDPGAQVSSVGSPAALQLQVTDHNSGATVTFAGQNLPPGLSIDANTGLISGTPTTAGTYTVTVSALDSTGATASQTFSWTVSAASSSVSGGGGSGSGTGTGSGSGSGAGGGSTTSSGTASSVGPVELSPVSAQRTMVHQGSSVQLKASDGGAAISYLATGLPPGLSLNARSGRISGAPSKPGSYTVTFAATAPGAAPAAGRFTWVVEGRPRISGVSVHGVAARRPALALRIVPGALAAGGIRKVTLALPRGLAVAVSAPRLHRLIAVRGPGGVGLAFRASVTSRGAQLVLTLSRTAARAEFRVAAPALSSSRGLARSARAARRPWLALGVTMTDGAGVSGTVATRYRAS